MPVVAAAEQRFVGAPPDGDIKVVDAGDLGGCREGLPWLVRASLTPSGQLDASLMLGGDAKAPWGSSPLVRLWTLACLPRNCHSAKDRDYLMRESGAGIGVGKAKQNACHERSDWY